MLTNARSHVRNKVLAGELAARILKAKNADEVRALLADCAQEFQLLEISVVPAAPYFHQPSARQISPLGDRPFRVDYPVAWEHGGHVSEIVLRIWAARPDPKRHLGADRIASRLGLALEQWLKDHPGEFGTTPAAAEVAQKRLSPHAGSRLES